MGTKPIKLRPPKYELPLPANTHLTGSQVQVLQEVIDEARISILTFMAAAMLVDTTYHGFCKWQNMCTKFGEPVLKDMQEIQSMMGNATQ